jgi:threonine dehydrogenase-like Zn-dependent dehydrogenase
MSDEEGALVEPVSVAYHSIWGRGGGVAPHDTVAVFGTGPIGIFVIQVAKVAGALVIAIEPQASRQKMAKEIGGADVIVDPSKEDVNERLQKITGGAGCSLVVECSGSKAGIAATIDAVGVEGRIVLTGQSMGLQIPAELGKTIWKHATIAGACGSPHFFPKTIAYMSRGRVDFKKMITNRFPLAEATKAFEVGKKAERGKILLVP